MVVVVSFSPHGNIFTLRYEICMSHSLSPFTTHKCCKRLAHFTLLITGYISLEKGTIGKTLEIVAARYYTGCLSKTLILKQWRHLWLIINYNNTCWIHNYKFHISLPANTVLSHEVFPWKWKMLQEMLTANAVVLFGTHTYTNIIMVIHILIILSGSGHIRADRDKYTDLARRMEHLTPGVTTGVFSKWMSWSSSLTKWQHPLRNHKESSKNNKALKSKNNNNCNTQEISIHFIDYNLL